jgi:Flp pilus assembly protein protease CpaA
MNAAGAAVAVRRDEPGVGIIGRDSKIVVVTVLAAVVSVAVLGRSVAAPVGAAGVLAVLAAVSDARARRIPNSIPIAVVLWVVVGACLVLTLDHRPGSEVVGSVVSGLVLSGAPLLAAVWVVRASAIGGGDVKLLGALGCTLGLLAPYAACVLVLVAVIVALGQVVVARRRHVILGPALAVGYGVAVVVGAVANEILGGKYQ